MNSQNAEPDRSALVIRGFEIADYDALLSLWDDAQLPYKPHGRDARETIEAELEQENSIFIVAEMNGRLLGSVFGTDDGRKGWINRLAVTPELRHQGIARKLVAEVEERLYGLGIKIIACLIEDWNIESMEVFERFGYERHKDITYFTKRKHPGI